MNKRFLLASMIVVGAFLLQARAEDLQLFQASKDGEEAWVWGGAKAKLKDGKLLVSLHNSEGAAGDTYVAARFPYFPNGKVNFVTEKVTAGDYTLQVLGFKNNVNVATAPLISHATEAGKQSFTLKDAGLTNGVDEVLFKVWVGGATNAAVVIDDLTYSLPLDGYTTLFDEHFQKMELWTNESLVVNTTGEGAVVTLRPDTTFGAILLAKQFPLESGMKMLWNIARIDNGDATLQFVGFDKDGKYVKSMDGAKNVRNGWYVMSLPGAAWPPEVASVQIKLWVGGQATAAARFRRLLLIKPAS
jgi:hypothetical protein